MSDFSCVCLCDSGCLDDVPNLLNVSLTSANSTPDAPVPDGGTRSAQDQDAPANSSDSESSFSD